METKYVNNKINNIFESKDFEDLPKEVVDRLFELMKGFEFEDNDDLRLLLSRIQQQFLAKFIMEWGKHQFEKMNCYNIHNKTIL